MKNLKIKHKVTIAGLSATIAFGAAAALTVNISTVQAASSALDKTYGIEGIETSAHLMDLLQLMQDVEKKAKAGDASAQYQIGAYYYRGMNIGMSLEKAVFWLSKAHKQGHLEASRTLGEIFSQYSNDGQGKIMAFRYFKVAADGGLVNAQVDLGVMYYLGRGTKLDFNKSLDLFIKASKQGSSRAEFYIGVMYDLGQGVKQDLAKALYWYELSSTSNKFSALNAGIAHDQGRGTVVSKSEALKYYKLAANLGSSQAQFRLGSMYYLGEGTERNLEDAFVWLMVAQAQGHKKATKAGGIVMGKMTVKQVRSAAVRIDKILDAKIQRRF